MTVDPAEQRVLLEKAEHTIVAMSEEIKALKQDKEHLERAINDMMEAQMMEAEQMVQLTEKCWTLESALEEALDEKVKVLSMVKELNSGLESLKQQADHALENARSETSKVKLASELMHLATAARENTKELDEQLKILTRIR